MATAHVPACLCRYAATYGVRLDPHTQALSLIGSQEGLGHLLMAIADPGDGILMLDVAYPSYFGAGQHHVRLVPATAAAGRLHLAWVGGIKCSIAQVVAN